MLFSKTLISLSAALISLSGAAMPILAESSTSVNLQVFTPKSGDISGIGSRAVMVDLAARFSGNLASTGASPELTGPGVHTNVPPFPGSFGLGHNDHFPSLVVLLSSSKVGAGPGQNVSNLFEIITVTNQKQNQETEIWSTWIIGAPNTFGTVGQNTPSRLFVAVVQGTAPDVVRDMDNNGVYDEKDLKLMGVNVISNVEKREFIINGF